MELKRLHFKYRLEFPNGEAAPIDYDPNDNDAGRLNGHGQRVEFAMLLYSLEVTADWHSRRTAVRMAVHCNGTHVLDIMVPRVAADNGDHFSMSPEIFCGEFARQLHGYLWHYEHGREVDGAAIDWRPAAEAADWYKPERIMADLPTDSDPLRLLKQWYKDAEARE